VIRVYDEAGNVIGTHDHTSDFKEVMNGFNRPKPLYKEG
jgi:hypothetical protein